MADKLHCIAKKHNGYWSARCLDFSLYATGDTLSEAKQKLNIEVNEYLYDAIEGKDQRYAAQLLLRRADASEWVLFYLLKFSANFQALTSRIGESFSPVVPSGPFHHSA